MMEGPGADSEEKQEPASDIDIAVVDSLKALDPKRPIREADIEHSNAFTQLKYIACSERHICDHAKIWIRRNTFL